MLLMPFFTFLVLKMPAWMRLAARQWGSKHLSQNLAMAAGIDATTGPLGQGISTATGFGPGRTFLAAKYNREGYNIFDHYIYVICGDGDLMEGVSRSGFIRICKTRQRLFL